MLIGDKETFAVECYHDAFPDQGRSIFGRMCLWLGGKRVGDIDEPACMLNVTGKHLRALLPHIDELDDPALQQLGDADAFAFLNRALYLDDSRSSEQIAADFKRFFKFDLLTNGGESFDRTKSFILRDGDEVRILFEDEQHGGFVFARVERERFALVVRGFLDWLAEEGEKAGGNPSEIR